MNYSILQWNVWFQEKAENIISQLQACDADIVCLQELTTDSYINPGTDLPRLIADLGYYSAYYQTLKRDGDHYYHMGNGLFSKYPILRTRQVLLREAESINGHSTETRAYLEATLETPSGDLTVSTAHLSFGAELAHETDRLLETIEGHPPHFIFTGDLNARPESETVTRLAEKLTHAGPAYEVGTWPSKHVSYDNNVIPYLSHRYDYIFTSDDITVVDSDAVQTEHSDHLPVKVTITF
ncbi:MAG TPA: endonuclease/exonuclease/phosphatase family protein [Candidatus Saccharimonadales bacterium]|nr:endonuclease/exonuclease/phosphatase family protein [Candidatus Saccharimonadales bacterium]